MNRYQLIQVAITRIETALQMMALDMADGQPIDVVTLDKALDRWSDTVFGCSWSDLHHEEH